MLLMAAPPSGSFGCHRTWPAVCRRPIRPGRTPFWIAGRKIEVKRLDLRPQAVEITAQEMLTKDRIALRVTLTAFRRVIDPERVVAREPDVDAWLYRLVQFAIREAVAGRTLDEVLSAKAALDAELRDYVRPRVADSGVEVTELGVRDVILPRRDPRAGEQGGGGGPGREGQPDPPAGRDRGNALAAEHRPPDGREPAPAAAQGTGVPWAEKVGRIDLHTGDGQGFDALLKLIRLRSPETA
jgi:hypothetical protein